MKTILPYSLPPAGETPAGAFCRLHGLLASLSEQTGTPQPTRTAVFFASDVEAFLAACPEKEALLRRAVKIGALVIAPSVPPSATLPDGEAYLSAVAAAFALSARLGVSRPPLLSPDPATPPAALSLAALFGAPALVCPAGEEERLRAFAVPGGETVPVIPAEAGKTRPVSGKTVASAARRRAENAVFGRGLPLAARLDDGENGACRLLAARLPGRVTAAGFCPDPASAQAVENEADRLSSFALSRAASPRPGQLAAGLVFCPGPQPLAGSVTLSLSLPRGTGFSVRDAAGRPLPASPVARTPDPADPAREICAFSLSTPPVPALGFFPFALVSQRTGAAKRPKKPKTGVENATFSLALHEGRLRVTHKPSGRSFPNPFFWEDQGDRTPDGAFTPAAEGSLIAFPDEWSLEDDGYTRTVRAICRMDLPRAYDRAAEERTDETVPVTCALTLSLVGEEDVLRVSWEVRDAAADHRLRLVVKTDGVAETAISDDLLACAPVSGGETVPASFFALTRPGAALLLLPEDPCACAHRNDAACLTVSRVGSADGGTRVSRGGLIWSPESTNEPAVLFARALTLSRSLSAGARPADEPMPAPVFADGTEGSPVRPLPDLPFSYAGDGVVLTAVRPAPEGGLLLRFLSLAEAETCLRLRAPGCAPAVTAPDGRAALPLGAEALSLPLAPGQVVTLSLRPGRGPGA